MNEKSVDAIIRSLEDKQAPSFAQPIRIDLGFGTEYRISVSPARPKVYLDSAHGPNRIRWVPNGPVDHLEIILPGRNAFDPGNPIVLGNPPYETPSVNVGSVSGEIYYYAIRVTFPDGNTVLLDPEYERDR